MFDTARYMLSEKVLPAAEETGFLNWQTNRIFLIRNKAPYRQSISFVAFEDRQHDRLMAKKTWYYRTAGTDGIQMELNSWSIFIDTMVGSKAIIDPNADPEHLKTYLNELKHQVAHGNIQWVANEYERVLRSDPTFEIEIVTVDDVYDFYEAIGYDRKTKTYKCDEVAK